MRTSLLLAAALLAACASARRALEPDDDGPLGRPPGVTAAEEERRARQALAEIQARVDRGELPKIQFEFDKSDITPDSGPTLDLVARLLLDNPRLKLFVLAHADSTGGDEYNLALSERRAREVKGWLVKKGVPPPSIRFKGLGSSMPLADNATDEGRAKNRRVELRVTYRDWESVY